MKRRQKLVHCRDGKQDKRNILNTQTEATKKMKLLQPAQDLTIERGELQYVYGYDGSKYLDCQAGVSNVGHCHPDVVAAMQGPQRHTLKWNGHILENTGPNSSRSRFVDKLKMFLPPGLSEVVIMNSGSEANELAIQMARAVSGGEDIVVFENSFHGSLSTVTSCSPIIFKNIPKGKKAWVQVLPIPDLYRGKYREDDPEAVSKYIDEAKKQLRSVVSKGRKIAALLMEPLFTFHGLQKPPVAYIQELVMYIKSLGALVIIDEVQTGLGRVGATWAHTSLGIRADILTVGKPLSNAYPLAILATSPRIAAPMSAVINMINLDVVNTAASLAAFEVMEKEHLHQNSREVGQELQRLLADVAMRRPQIGQIRGSGLLVAIDLVTDKTTREPATQLAEQVYQEMKERKILISLEGAMGNVIYLMPPLCFTLENAAVVSTTLEEILQETENETEDEDEGGGDKGGDSPGSSDYDDMN